MNHQPQELLDLGQWEVFHCPDVSPCIYLIRLFSTKAPNCAQLTAVLVHGDASLHAAAVVGLVVVPVLKVQDGAVLPSEGRVVGVLVEADPVGVAVLVQLGQQELVLGRVVDGGQVAALVRKIV